jgi:hypothetical protein
MPPSKFLSKEDILRAMQNTKSNHGAARFLRCSLNHYKKYAKVYIDEATGLDLNELHKNASGKGIPKFLSNKGKKAPLKELIAGTLSIESFEPAKIKQRLVFEGYLKEECCRCGFHEERLADQKIPLILQFKDRNKKNYELANIELMCYNCSYLYAISPISEQQVIKMEDYIEKKAPEFEWEIDDTMKEHLESLGLWKQDFDPTDGANYVSENFRDYGKTQE